MAREPVDGADLIVPQNLQFSSRQVHNGISLRIVQQYDIVNDKIPCRWEYHGRLSDDALCALYNRAFCFVYPSDSEGFGLPLLEAMRAGCPVVCSNLTVFPEVAGNAALFADHQTGAAYAQQMVRLSDPDLRAEMIARGLERVRLFTWENCFNKTLDAYKLALQIRLQGVVA